MSLKGRAWALSAPRLMNPAPSTLSQISERVAKDSPANSPKKMSASSETVLLQETVRLATRIRVSAHAVPVTTAQKTSLKPSAPKLADLFEVTRVFVGTLCAMKSVLAASVTENASRAVISCARYWPVTPAARLWADKRCAQASLAQSPSVRAAR